MYRPQHTNFILKLSTNNVQCTLREEASGVFPSVRRHDSQSLVATRPLSSPSLDKFSIVYAIFLAICPMFFSFMAIGLLLLRVNCTPRYFTDRVSFSAGSCWLHAMVCGLISVIQSHEPMRWARVSNIRVLSCSCTSMQKTEAF